MNQTPSREAVAFESEGALLRGFLYPAARGNAPFPIVIMAHGTSATISMVADRYAEVFALFDFKNLFVADASLFPAGCNVNPQMTAMALAHLAADEVLTP